MKRIVAKIIAATVLALSLAGIGGEAVTAVNWSEGPARQPMAANWNSRPEPIARARTTKVNWSE